MIRVTPPARRDRRLRVVIVHNRDFDPRADVRASQADVQNAVRDVAHALTERGHLVDTLTVEATADVALEGLLRAVNELKQRPPDMVFNLCESLAADNRYEPVLPSLLDLAGIPYTGSGPLGLAMALRKDLTKRVLQASGVATPDAVLVDSGTLPPLQHLGRPLMVKPSREDASVGISWSSVVTTDRELVARVAEIRARFQQPALVERFLPGRELYVSIVGGEPLPMHEIDFSTLPPELPRIVTYAGKWDTGSLDYQATKPIRAVGLDARTRTRCHQAALAAFAALDLRDYARVDLRLTDDGTPWVIDVNPNCDLCDGAGVSRAATFAGLGYSDLIDRILESALARTRKESELHVDSRAGVPAGDAGSTEPPTASAAPDGRPKRARAADTSGALHGSRGAGRARANRRRTR
jgi:D-alanine-D-alanine ligase